MVGGPRDKTAYGIAIASLGFALVAALIGICWLSAQNGDPSSTITTHHCVLHAPILCGSKVVSTAAVKPPQPPDGLWIALAALGGVLVGALIPLPLAAFPSPSEWRSGNRAWGLFVAFAFGAFIVGLVVAAHDDLKEPFVWCAIGGVLLGLLIPSPARGD
jgi:MFS family permease